MLTQPNQLEKEWEVLGYLRSRLQLPQNLRGLVLERNWRSLYLEIAKLVAKGGLIFNELEKYAFFSEIEFIISIRSSIEYPDEDGIWHDDGSRVLAFSMSLTLSPELIQGGHLEIRKKGSQEGVEIPTPSYGEFIVFATGYKGFEHRICRVTQGERLIIAGWCT